MTRWESRYLEPSARPRQSYIYYVSGVGSFPMDMLRYDAAWPADSEAANEMVLDQFNHQASAVRSIKLCSYREPTIARWQSFLWSVGTEKL